jgi:hypothetical protein
MGPNTGITEANDAAATVATIEPVVSQPPFLVASSVKTLFLATATLLRAAISAL